MTAHQKNMLPWQDSTKSLNPSYPTNVDANFPPHVGMLKKLQKQILDFQKKTPFFGRGCWYPSVWKKKQKSLHTKMHGSVWGASVATLGNPPSKHQTANIRFDRKTNDVASLKMNSSHLQGSLSKRTKFHLPTSNFQVIFSLLSGRVRLNKHIQMMFLLILKNSWSIIAWVAHGRCNIWLETATNLPQEASWLQIRTFSFHLKMPKWWLR